MIELTDRWSKQPQGTGRLAPLFRMSDVVSGIAPVLTQRNPLTVTGTITQVPTQGGKAFVSGTTGSYLNLGKVRRPLAGQFAIVAQFIADSTSQRAISGSRGPGQTQIEDLWVNTNQGSDPAAGKICFVLRDDSSNLFRIASTNAVLTVGALHTVVVTVNADGATGNIFLDGQDLPVSYGNVGAYAASAGFYTNDYALCNDNLDGTFNLGTEVRVTLFARLFTRNLDPRALSRNPWSIFAKRPDRLFLSVGGGGGVTGTAAVTLGNDTSSATGTTTVLGTAALTLGNATSSATGVVGSVSGTAAITLGNDTSSAQGTTSIGGTGAVTLGNDFSTASGAVGSAVTGTAAITLGNDTSSATGTTMILGSAAITLGADFSTTQGTTTILGSAAITLGDDFATAFGTSGTPTTVSSPRGLTIRIGLAL